MRNTKGITLIALIITIIVLLILAGVSINLIVGENGILRQSSDAVNTYKQKENQESGEFDNLYNEFGNYINELTGKGDNDSDRVDSTSTLWDFDATTGTINYYKGTKSQLNIENNTIKIPTHIDGIEVKQVGYSGRPVFSGSLMNSSEISGEKLKLPNTLQVIGSNAFNQCAGFTGNLEIPDSVTKIDTRAFAECSGFTGKLKLPSAIEFIGMSAFYACTGFTGDLYIPYSVTTMYGEAFYACTGLNGKLTLCNVYGASDRFRYTNFNTIEIQVKEIDQNTMNDGIDKSKIEQLIITDKVEKIGDSAFENFTALKGELEIPSSVKSIGQLAFSNCSGLTTIIVPATTAVADDAFQGTTTTIVRR